LILLDLETLIQIEDLKNIKMNNVVQTISMRKQLIHLVCPYYSTPIPHEKDKLDIWIIIF